MAQLNAAGGIGVVNYYVQWPKYATLSLIQYRHLFQQEFCRTSIHRQKRIWNQISQSINVDHLNFAPTKKQCRNKWNSLKSGFENLKRILNGNPERFPTHMPTLHDEHFHEELSDEFWLAKQFALQGGTWWTVDDMNIESTGALDPGPSITVMSVGALDLDLLVESVESAGAIIPLPP
ncbi:hypothetical protein C1646_776143 [Rhizophagus diaphanus]|nr:hypothetical protein C1646_776143 [Rhizophagus diaphanus] [Rhizophagus sp. MUCL 43196]